MGMQTPSKIEREDGVILVKNNDAIDKVITEKVAQLTEDIAALYGIKIFIEDTDWQPVFDLKAEVYNTMSHLGVEIEQPKE